MTRALSAQKDRFLAENVLAGRFVTTCPQIMTKRPSVIHCHGTAPLACATRRAVAVADGPHHPANYRTSKKAAQVLTLKAFSVKCGV
jgi:hypothetical protein